MLGMLGRLPRRIDARSPVLARLAANNPLPAAPAAVAMPAIAWPMLGNDRIGDCTIAACFHQVQAWAAPNQFPCLPTEAAAISVYSTATGYNPADPASDQGAVEIDILHFWMAKGIALNDTDAGDQLDGYATIACDDVDMVKRAIAAFGGVYAGIALPLSAQEQAVWDVPAGGVAGDGAVGSWGGHAVPLLGFDAAGPVAVSWGAPKPMTWAFWQAYADEAYALLSLDWIKSSASPRGLPWRSLVADIHAMSGAMRYAS